ncbi:MAG: hypothetical protein HFJ10_03655 [Lachnospiraceae bacterium]|jgi:hypothetical protein|nr:hypothetical protein [Lachnospiraceae bacterium]
MKKEISYIQIENAIGGNQDWFLDPFMHGGGCGAVTACDICIYLARERGLHSLYPFDAKQLTKKDYVHFSKRMKPFLHPRWQGIDTLDLYLSGIRAYWESVGCDKLEANGLLGTVSVEEAETAVRRQIDEGMPIPYLLLKHESPSFRDYVWHWFNLTGYEESGGEFYVKAVTYGEFQWLNLKELWDTGYEKKGGMILVNFLSR